jgi:hypothetical protein
MPHCKNGHELKVGDVVMIPAKVVSVEKNPDYCNCQVETLEPMHPGKHKSTFTINTKQCVRADEEVDGDKKAIVAETDLN